MVARMRSATSNPDSMGVWGIHTANSSPPMRATRSLSRTAPSRMRATWRRARAGGAGGELGPGPHRRADHEVAVEQRMGGARATRGAAVGGGAAEDAPRAAGD